MKKKVIFITDGDEYATEAAKFAAAQVNGSCIVESSGNPTKLTGEELLSYILRAEKEPVFVLFDDSGLQGEGPGEKALRFLACNKNIEVLGIIAVSSNAHSAEWTRVDVSIDRDGNLTEFGVDKSGLPDIERGRINGDTVYCLDQLNVPLIVGIGDIGKMADKDSKENGFPITMAAVELILERSRWNASNNYSDQ